nr:hypothetical protein [Vallitaleaceae bacterium]
DTVSALRENPVFNQPVNSREDIYNQDRGDALASDAENPFATGNNRVYYIDSLSGDNGNDGTMEAPLKDLEGLNAVALLPGDEVLFRRDTVYRGQLIPKSGSIDHEIYYGAYGVSDSAGDTAEDGRDPIIAPAFNAYNQELWLTSANNILEYATAIPYDVGNIIFNSGDNFTITNQTDFGIKKWSLDDLSQDGDYYYDSDNKKLYMYASKSLSNLYTNIECCVNLHAIDETNVSYVTYEDLHLTFGSGHGIGGGNTSHITVRHVEVSYMGGSYLHDTNGVPTRYGNGIEFWGNATDIEVESCTIYEIFDSGLTNQNNTTSAIQERITYQGNDIYNCGMASFEIGNKPSGGNLKDIYFYNNTCSDVGVGWHTTQSRYTDSSANLSLSHHVTIFYMETPVDHLIIEGNVFDGYTHPDNKGSFYLMMNITDTSLPGIIIRNNTYVNGTHTFSYFYDDSTLSNMDQSTFDEMFNH